MTANDPAQQHNDILHQGLAELGLQKHPGVEALQRYVAELERWNSRLGLVHAAGADLIVRHILDSLAGLAVVRSLVEGVDRPVVADIGSGGGLPGIPLACFLPEYEMLLVERSAKKCGFLRGALIVSGLSNARVVQADVATLRDVASIVVLRAFRALTEETVRVLMRCVRPDGALCAYKGRRDRIAEELSAGPGDLVSAGTPEGELTRDGMAVEIIPIRVPLLREERHLVIVRERKAGGESSTDHPSPRDR